MIPLSWIASSVQPFGSAAVHLLGALVASLAADVDHLHLGLGPFLVRGIHEQPEDDVGVAAGLPWHDQLGDAARDVDRLRGQREGRGAQSERGGDKAGGADAHGFLLVAETEAVGEACGAAESQS